MNEKVFVGQLGQIQAQAQTQAQLKQADIFDSFRQAKIEYDESCREFARISNLKEQNAKRLAQLSHEISQLIQVAMYDPTQPQPPDCAPSNANGRW